MKRLESPINIREYGQRAARLLNAARLSISAATEISRRSDKPGGSTRSMLLLHAAGAHSDAARAIENACSLIREITG